MNRFHRFDDDFRAEVATRCAAFERQVPEGDLAGLKQAAVAFVLVESDAGPNDTAFLLTRRASGLRAHGGQWALPGGRCDAGETVVESALRELREEVGLVLTSDHVLGLLDDYPTRSGYLIAPVVMWAGPAAKLQPNPAEVASVHRISLEQIVDPDAVDFITSPESGREVVRVLIDGDRVHAPTAAIIYQFREILAGRQTRVATLEQPRFAWQ